MSECNAVQFSDQMTCSCGNVWDMNDPYPPECKKEPAMTEPNHIAEARKKVSRPQIREVFLRNGAHIEPGHDDLPDYVYESVFELLDLAAPAVQGEPVAEEVALFECASCNHLYQGQVTRCDCMPGEQKFNRWLARPERAEQQPAPDVSGLVEALELISVTDPNEGVAWFHEIAYRALVAYRKGGDQA